MRVHCHNMKGMGRVSGTCNRIYDNHEQIMYKKGVAAYCYPPASRTGCF